MVFTTSTSSTSSVASILLVLIAIALGFLAQKSQQPLPFSTQPCSVSDNNNNNNNNSNEAFDLELFYTKQTWNEQHSLLLPKQISLDPCRVYSETYHEARQKFRVAATNAGAVLHSLPIHVPLEQVASQVKETNHNHNKENGDENDTTNDNHLLTLDVAVLYGSLRGLVVHTSGVHGVEAYAASAVQIAFLQSIYPFWNNNNTHSKHSNGLPTIVLVHAVNPYGMAHYRRTNENNVDLNRNGIHPENWKNVQTNAETANQVTSIYQAYGKFSSFFNPPGPPSRLYVVLTLWIQAATYLARYGFDALKAGMVTGQYYNAKGIFYGGNELQPSLSALYNFFQNVLLVSDSNDDHHTEENAGQVAAEKDETLAQPPQQQRQQTIKNVRCCTGTVTWIDVHTGLGPSGQDSLLVGTESASYLEQQAQVWFPGANVEGSSKDAAAVKKGYEHVQGVTSRLFGRLWHGEQRQQQQQSETCLHIMQEFGTVPGILVAHALIVENRAFHHLPPEEAMEWAKHTTKRAFYKQTSVWRKQILERGLILLVQAVQRSAADKV